MRPTVYIPSFNGKERLSALLFSLRKQTTQVEVVIAENDSHDGTVEMLETDFPEVKVVRMPRNLGFGTALNRAISEQPGDPIILLNQDVVCPPEFIEKLLNRAAGGSAMIAALLVSEAEPGIIDSAGVIADRTLMGFDYLNGLPVAAAAKAPSPLGPTGAAALYKADSFNRVGGFDERIFLYYEDLDLALRLRAIGADCELAPEAQALHAYSDSLGAGSSAKYRYTGWSRGYMIRRYRVVANPRSAVRVLAAEGVLSLGQAVIDRSCAGLRGRFAGWQAARDLSAREIPTENLTALTLRQSLALRRRRRGPLMVER